MEKFLGWLTDDEFTHQRATFLGHDPKSDCGLWQHNSDPLYPAQMNQTACIRTGGGGTQGPVPVYMHWHADSEHETKVFSAWRVVDTFPASLFEPPPHCTFTPPAMDETRYSKPSRHSD